MFEKERAEEICRGLNFDYPTVVHSAVEAPVELYGKFDFSLNAYAKRIRHAGKGAAIHQRYSI